MLPAILTPPEAPAFETQVVMIRVYLSPSLKDYRLFTAPTLLVGLAKAKQYVQEGIKEKDPGGYWEIIPPHRIHHIEVYPE